MIKETTQDLQAITTWLIKSGRVTFLRGDDKIFAAWRHYNTYVVATGDEAADAETALYQLARTIENEIHELHSAVVACIMHNDFQQHDKNNSVIQ